MCYMPCGIKGQLSYYVWQSLNRIYFSFSLLVEPLNWWRKGGNRSTQRKPLATSFRKCHILKPESSSLKWDLNPHNSIGGRLESRHDNRCTTHYHDYSMSSPEPDFCVTQISSMSSQKCTISGHTQFLAGLSPEADSVAHFTFKVPKLCKALIHGFYNDYTYTLKNQNQNHLSLHNLLTVFLLFAFSLKGFKQCSFDLKQTITITTNRTQIC